MLMGTSTNLGFFHTVSACASQLREGIEMMVCVPTAFLMTYFWVQQGSLVFDGKKTDRKQAQNAL